MSDLPIRNLIEEQVKKMLVAKDNSYPYLVGFLQIAYGTAIETMSDEGKVREIERLTKMVEMLLESVDTSNR